MILPICILILCNTPVFADEQSHRKLASEFMVLTDVEELMTQTFKSIKDSQAKKTADLQYPGKSPEKDKVFLDRVQKYMDGKLVWNNFKKSYEEVYTAVFSEEELKALVDFYSSPVGKKIQKNGLELRRKLLQSTQMQLKDFGLQLKKIEKDFLDEQKK